LPVLGQKIVNQITAYDLEIIKQKLREKLSARYTNSILVNIGTIMKYGWKLGFCNSNPAQLVGRYGVDRGASTTITPDEAVLLSRHLNEPFRTIFFTILSTGARVGEIVGLMWKDIDFRNDLISIERNVFHASKNKYGMLDNSWVFGTPKSKESVRKIYMVPALKTALLRHSETTQGNSLGLVFCTTKGNPYDRSTLRSKLNTALKAAGLKHIRIHDLRHSSATWLLARGVDLSYVSRHLGHSKVAITTDTYYHFLPKVKCHTKLMDNVFPTWNTAGIH
jgi:integrase